MHDLLSIMFLPFLACIILTGIHAYLGLHIVRRGVIFVDLALAQVAAFGGALAFLFGFGLHTTGSYLISLLCSLTGAILLALTRSKTHLVPQEALVGVIYAVAGAASVLVLSLAPEGGEELKALLVGHLLFIEWNEVAKIAVLYSAVGLLHFIFRDKFLLISEDPERATREGLNLKRWDFLFYSLFAIVVTSSVEIAGVLLVFSFLVVPALCGALLSSTILGKLITGWTVALIASVVGILFSYFADLPTGAAIVVVFGAALLVCGLGSSLVNRVR